MTVRNKIVLTVAASAEVFTSMAVAASAVFEVSEEMKFEVGGVYTTGNLELTEEELREKQESWEADYKENKKQQTVLKNIEDQWEKAKSWVTQWQDLKGATFDANNAGHRFEAIKLFYERLHRDDHPGLVNNWTPVLWKRDRHGQKLQNSETPEVLYLKNFKELLLAIRDVRENDLKGLEGVVLNWFSTESVFPEQSVCGEKRFDPLDKIELLKACESLPASEHSPGPRLYYVGTRTSSFLFKQLLFLHKFAYGVRLDSDGGGSDKVSLISLVDGDESWETSNKLEWKRETPSPEAHEYVCKGFLQEGAEEYAAGSFQLKKRVPVFTFSAAQKIFDLPGNEQIVDFGKLNLGPSLKSDSEKKGDSRRSQSGFAPPMGADKPELQDFACAWDFAQHRFLCMVRSNSVSVTVTLLICQEQIQNNDLEEVNGSGTNESKMENPQEEKKEWYQETWFIVSVSIVGALVIGGCIAVYVLNKKDSERTFDDDWIDTDSDRNSSEEEEQENDRLKRPTAYTQESADHRRTLS